MSFVHNSSSSGSGSSVVSTSSSSSQIQGRLWQTLESLRHRDRLIGSAMVTGSVGVGTIVTWVVVGCTGSTSLIIPLAVVTAADLGFAKFLGGKDGIMKVFTDYFPKALELTRSQMKFSPAASPTGFWQGNGIDVRWSHFFDAGLASEISKLLNEEGVRTSWDFGCGFNKYSVVLGKNGIDCQGLEGSPDLVPLSQVQDLALPFNRGVRECVISLEVGAKIPKEYEEQFLNNINAHASKMLIISWPVNGQKGPNQVNTQDNAYIIEKFKSLGWKIDQINTQRLRDHSSPIFYWFSDTLMVFRKES